MFYSLSILGRRYPVVTGKVVETTLEVLPFLVTKLSRPRISRYHLPRQHLLALLQEGLTRRLTALIAAAGHGKTCTLGHFLARTGAPYLWIQIDPTDSDLRTFGHYLARGIHAELKGGNRAAFALEQGGPLPQILPLLVADLADCSGPVCIVLDDFHLVDRDSPVVPMVASLLQYAGEHVHFFICSRTPLPFSIARLKVTQEALEITEDDLRFTPAEVESYLREMAGITVDDAQLEQVCHLTEGWSAALVLLASGLKRRGSLDTVLGGALPADLFTYLADELVDSLPPEMQRFMEESSVLDACSPTACDAILERRDSAALLAQLLSSNILLTQLGPDSFRYHHLLQRFLQERLRQADGGRRYADLQKRAGDWYLAREDPEEAVRYYLKGGGIDEAAGLVENLAPLWLRTNRMDRLRGLLSYLPTEMKERYPWVSLCEARQLLNTGQPDPALGMARMALRSFEDRNDVRGIVLAYTLIGEILVSREQFAEAAASYIAAESVLRPEHLYEEGLLLHRRAELNFHTKGPGPEADLRRALSIFVQFGDLPMEAYASDLLGVVRGMLGDFASAIRFQERALEISRSLGEPSYELGTNLAWSYCMVGRFADAAAIYEPMLASSSRKLRRSFAAVNLVYIYTRMGEFGRAAAISQTAHTLTEEMSFPQNRVVHATSLAGLYRISGQPQVAVPYANEAIQMAKQIEQANIHLRPVTETALLHLFHTGNAAAAARIAERALGRLTSEEAHPYERMQLAMIQAMAEFRQSRSETRPQGVTALQEAMAECNRRGYDFFALHEWQLALTVVIYGLAYGIHTDLCLRIVQLLNERLPASVLRSGVALMEAEARLIPAAWQALPTAESRQWLAALLTPGDRRRVVGLAAGPAPLRIQCFGPLTITSGSESLDPKAIKKRKSGTLLVLLLTHESPLNREQVIDRLWPDLDPVAADTSLRVSLHHLRRLLEPHVGGKSKSRYIQSEGGLIWFSRQPEVSVDLDRFREAMTQAEEALSGADLAAAARHFEAACKVYRGDLAADELYTEVLEELRRAQRERYFLALDWLAEYYWREAQDAPKAILILKQRLAQDPAHEQAHQSLMRIYLEVGQVGAARAQYTACREALQTHLSVTPSRATESLLQLALSMESEAPAAGELGAKRLARRR